VLQPVNGIQEVGGNPLTKQLALSTTVLSVGGSSAILYHFVAMALNQRELFIMTLAEIDR
jgi:hypothetical protein